MGSVHKSKRSELYQSLDKINTDIAITSSISASNSFFIELSIVSLPSCPLSLKNNVCGLGEACLIT